MPPARFTHLHISLLKKIMDEEMAASMYMPSMGMFVDNQDLTRFSTLNSSASALRCVTGLLVERPCISRHALRNALTFTYFIPGIPIVFYGTEQQATGWQYNQSNRGPMWTYGFDEGSDFFTWIRMLNWCAFTTCHDGW